MKASTLVVALAKRVPFPFRLLFALDQRHLLPPTVCQHWVLQMVARELNTVSSSDQWSRTVMYAECFDLVIADQVFEHPPWPYRAGRNVRLCSGRAAIFSSPHPF